MSVKELEVYFRELAPCAKHHCDKAYYEELTQSCRVYIERHAEKSPGSMPVDTPETNVLAASISAVWHFARAHVSRNPKLRDLPAYVAYAKDGEMILEQWLDDTNAMIDHLKGRGASKTTRTITHVRTPLADGWRRAHGMLVAVLHHVADESHTEPTELRRLCHALAGAFCKPNALGHYVTESWLQCTQGLASFRYVLQCKQGSLLDDQWSTGTWSHAGHAWHPELADLSFLVLKDLAVPMPWRGLGFSRLLRELERLLALTSAATGVDGLFLHHVHRDMLGLTLGRGAHGYRFWADPCATAEPDDAPFLASLDASAAEAIRSGTDRHARPWMFAFTEQYGATPGGGEIFHLYWLTPLGERRAAAQTRPSHRVLVPLGVLADRVKAASVFIADYVHGLEAHTKSPWHTTQLEDDDDAASGVTQLRLAAARPDLAEGSPWSLRVDVIPVLHHITGSAVESPHYNMFLAFLVEFVRCLCDTLVYAERTVMTQAPVLVQLMVRFTDDHYARDAAEMNADVRALFGDDFVCANHGSRPGVAAYMIHNKQVLAQPTHVK